MCMLHKEKLKVLKLGQIEGFGGGAYIYIYVCFGGKECICMYYVLLLLLFNYYYYIKIN